MCQLINIHSSTNDKCFLQADTSSQKFCGFFVMTGTSCKLQKLKVLEFSNVVVYVRISWVA